MLPVNQWAAKQVKLAKLRLAKLSRLVQQVQSPANSRQNAAKLPPKSGTAGLGVGMSTPEELERAETFSKARIHAEACSQKGPEFW